MAHATVVDRSRAKRLRKRKTPLSAEDSAWLDTYAREHPSPRYPRPNGAPPSPPPLFRPTMPTASPTEPAAPVLTPPGAAGEVSLPPEFFRAHAPDAAPPPEASPTSTALAVPAPGACTIKDCPRCAAVAAVQRCGTTGEEVHPPMDEAGANGGAALLLAIVGVVIWVVKRKHAPRATERERTQLAGAVRNVVYRRFNAAGQISDVLGLGWALTAYAMRAAREAE